MLKFVNNYHEKEPKRDEYEGSGSGGTVSSALHMHRHRQERGIKILTAEEQVERQVRKLQTGGGVLPLPSF
jgi:hypothetical protein